MTRPSSRAAAALGAVLLATPIVVTAAAPAPAQADDSSTITVVGTSDVQDSGLMDNVIKPGFEAYENSLGKTVTLNYVSKGTGAAIQYAEAGTASALIVHAASLENQFVAQGYSLESAGRAMTWGDFVLLGPTTGDPAGILGSDGSPSHDIVSTYEKIAAAGANGAVDFVSRGGTPGTTVAEHKIWALTSGVATCNVSAANGGGAVPSTTDVGTDCPSSPTPPSWYHATGLTQALNVQNADTCNYDSHQCYVFTDKGTYDYLVSQGSASTLQVVADDNDVAGQTTLLVNSFHVYGINPDKFSSDPNVQINSAAAHDLLTWTTSAAGQQAIGAYLTSAPGGAPFRPSAAPALTVSATPRKVQPGQPVTFFGNVANVVPGTPRLDGVTVTLSARPVDEPDATPSAVATATTGSDGGYSLKYTPIRNAVYAVSTPALRRVEDAGLDPTFSDLLQPASTVLGHVDVLGVVSRFAAENRPSTPGADVVVSGGLAPRTTAGAKVVLYGKHPGGGAFKALDSRAVPAGASSFDTPFPLSAGRWVLEVGYANDGVIDQGASSVARVTITKK